MADLAAMLHPFTCFGNGTTFHRILPDGPACERAAAAIAPRLTPDREALEHDHDDCVCRQPGTATHRHEFRHSHVVEHVHRHEHPTDGMVVRRIEGVTASQPVPTEPEEADR